jgi:hypothetical protein
MKITGRLPVWLKVTYTLWVILWVPVYWKYYGPQNFLWFSDISNFILLAALWAESPLLFSSQALSVLLINAGWTLELAARLFLGLHYPGGTAYMLDASFPLWLRLFSLFHIFVPLIILWALFRLGYDRRGLALQILIAWVVLPVCFFFTDPVKNINWVWGPFGVKQTILSPGGYLLACMVLYPLLIYLPTHLILQKWLGRRGP